METLNNNGTDGTNGTDARIILHNRLNGRIKPEYKEIEKTGPDNSPTFKYEVQINGTTYGIGFGRSKAAAMEEAARKAVEHDNKSGAFRKL